MGDRYAVGFTGFDETDNEERRVWLYSHWGGNVRHNEIAQAIEKARPRWSDPTYATRIAISQIVGDGWNQETGFGINAGPQCNTDIEYGAFLVDWNQKTVFEFSYNGWSDVLSDREDGSSTSSQIIATYSFDDFLDSYLKMEASSGC